MKKSDHFFFIIAIFLILNISGFCPCYGETQQQIDYEAYGNVDYMITSPGIIYDNKHIKSGNDVEGIITIPSSVIATIYPEYGHSISHSYRNVKQIGKASFANNPITSIFLPETIDRINSLAFTGCNEMTYVRMPYSLREIGDYAFSGCDKLSNVDLPINLTSIGTEAFSRCWVKTNSVDAPTLTVEIPTSVSNLGGAPFAYCDNLNEIKVSVFNENFAAYDGSLYTKDGKTLVQMIDKAGRFHEIPKGVERIGEKAFTSSALYRNIPEITIPSSVRYIEANGFAGCEKIKRIEIPANVDSIGLTPFSGCYSLQSINVNKNNKAYSSADGVLYDKAGSTLIQFPPGKSEYNFPTTVTRIETGAFTDSNVRDIIIPSTVNSIGDSIFVNCQNLQMVTLPDNLTQINKGFFRDCNNLRSVEFPNKLKTIGQSAFEGCEQLYLSEIPEGVWVIDSFAFYGCTNLDETLTFPESVKYISYGAFFNTNVKEVILRSLEVIQILKTINPGEAVFPKGNEIIAYVPANLADQYRRSPWKDEFKAIRIIRNENGMNETDADKLVQVSVIGDSIEVSGLDHDEIIRIFDISGREVYSGRNHTVDLNAGNMYLVVTPAKTFKVLM